MLLSLGAIFAPPRIIRSNSIMDLKQSILRRRKSFLSIIPKGIGLIASAIDRDHSLVASRDSFPYLNLRPSLHPQLLDDIASSANDAPDLFNRAEVTEHSVVAIDRMRVSIVSSAVPPLASTVVVVVGVRTRPLSMAVSVIR